MTYRYGKTSNARLDTCHPDLIRLFDYALLHEDCPCDISIVCGNRDQDAQEEAYSKGFSKAHFGQSPHNYEPSFAVDAVPYVAGMGIPWSDTELFDKLARHIKKCAEELNVEIQWGGDFRSFIDRPHWEIKGWKGMI